jgi:U3 small nucleolar RNA-associated protein 18
MPKTTVTVKEKTRQKTTANSRSPFEKGASSKPVDESDASDVEMGDDAEAEKVREKDEAEKKLERMLFGDDEGFVGALKSQDRDLMALMAKSDEESASEEDEDDDFDDRDLSDVADADLFFLDSGTAPVGTELAETSAAGSDSEEDTEGEETHRAVWHDSDDERLTISLASHQRLRKLRVTEAEDVISGKEYIKRLRRQFEQLHPVPDWANPELNKKPTDSDSDLDSDMDTDDENERLSTQPLAKLLQGATDLTTLGESTGAGGKRKLRQEVIDIHRLKDVGKDQPVSFCASRNISWFWY